MCCELVERQLGRYLDGELSDAQRSRVASHLAHCSSCRAELAELREMAAGIADTERGDVPDSLWLNIECRLEQKAPAPGAAQAIERPPARRGRWALAAAIVLAVFLGTLGIASLEPSAHASMVDFGVLLDALPLNPQKAFRKFLVRYGARQTTPAAAKRATPDLNFDTPAVLPGGFRLQSVYLIRIGDDQGVAAAYERNSEFLAVVFHPSMKHERFGSHRSYSCVIGKHCGHRVQVGEWKLIHLTDPQREDGVPSTCHCLLSRLDERTEVPKVMAALAPARPKDQSPHVP